MSLGKATAWPASFAIALPDGTSDGWAVVRLRAYPEGGTRDYLGERYASVATPCNQPSCSTAKPAACCLLVPMPVPAPASGPLLSSGQTPSTEPDPLLAIDRLVLVHPQAGTVGSATVVLATACAATMANITDFTALVGCADTAGVLEPLSETLLSGDALVPGPSSLVGTFEQALAQPCTTAPRMGSVGAGGGPLHDDEVCVPGGLLVLGGREGFNGLDTDPLPRHIVAVSSFLMDRYEYTVARARAGRAHVIVHAEANDGPLGTVNTPLEDPSFCTASSVPMGREEYPLNCVEWPSARALCQYEKGDLPTEAQWEYAAAQSGGIVKTEFPWGDSDIMACSGASYGRTAGGTCEQRGAGPVPVTTNDVTGGDVTPSLGLVDLGGNVGELALDALGPYTDNCRSAGLEVDPSCYVAGATDHPARGGNWVGEVLDMRAVGRLDDNDQTVSSQTGFRCVRPGSSGP